MGDSRVSCHPRHSHLAQELLSAGIRPIVLNCPHRIQWTLSDEKWAVTQPISLLYNELLTGFARRPPWRLLDMNAIMARCGDECNKDRVHALPPVNDAATQVILGMMTSA